MGTDASRAIHCIEKDLESLLRFFDFDDKMWTSLKTTIPIETINRQFKRRGKGMDTLGEKTLESVLAFVALKIELNWQKYRIDSKVFNKHRRNINTIEDSVAKIGLAK